MTAGEVVALVSALTALLSAVAGLMVALGSSTRRLRNGLTHDVQILPHVRGRTAAELQTDIRRRSHLLVASSRFPVLTLFDAGLVGMMLVPLLYVVILNFEVQTSPRGTVVMPDLLLFGAFLHVVGLIAFAKLTQEWTSRATKRIVYLYQCLGDDGSEAAAKTHSIAFTVIPLLVMAGHVAALFPLRVIASYMELPFWGTALVVGAVALIGFLGIPAITLFAAHELHEIITFYAPLSLLQYPSPSRLRPKSLGGDPGREFAGWVKTRKHASGRGRKRPRGRTERAEDGEGAR